MEHDDQEPKLFSLTEAERTRKEVEPWLVEAINFRRKIGEVNEQMGQIVSRIQMSGGIQIPFDSTVRLRMEHDNLVQAIKDALERIEATGCVVKDLDVGLLDFPARIGDEDVYLCWRLGEDRIRFYHRQDEGFAGRKPIDPRDTGPSSTIQ